MELWIVKNGIMTNITPMVGKVKLRSNMKELGDELTFDIAFNDTSVHPINPCDIGDMVIFKKEKEVFRGIIVTEQQNGRQPIQYTSFDFAFYLNESKAVYQFNNIPASEAITKMLNDFNIPVGTIEIPPIIDKIYNSQTISGIIKDILKESQKQSGLVYIFEMTNGKMEVYPRSDYVMTGSFKLTDNVRAYAGYTSISDPKRKRTIEGMKNAVQIIKNDRVVSTITDDSLIEQYGLLQDSVKVDKNQAQAETAAKNILKEFGKVLEENTLTMLGDVNLRAGRLLRVKEPTTGMNGVYEVNSVEHAFSKGIHTMNVSLGVV